MGKYDDILDIKYEGSTTRRRMSLEDRAAQFAPFAALTGHASAINEAARLTSKKIELSQQEQIELSRLFNILISRLRDSPIVKIVYFQPDPVKDGGRYVEAEGVVKRFDEYSRTIIQSDSRMIVLDNVIKIDSYVFDDID